jgi:hypothetical protein
MHIVLADIDPILFPDYYPFYKDFFKEEKDVSGIQRRKKRYGAGQYKIYGQIGKEVSVYTRRGIP